MSSVAIDQAFIQAFIDGAFPLEIAQENVNYTPVSGTAYAELINLPNDITPLSLNDSNETDGIFRVILNYPPNVGSINAKIQADAILSAFKIGTTLSYGGQSATITRNYRERGFNDGTWYRLVLTIGYFAVLPR